MFYREAGQFKTSYADDQAVFPIRQDRIGIAVILAIAFIAIPVFGSNFLLASVMAVSYTHLDVYKRQPFGKVSLAVCSMR